MHALGRPPEKLPALKVREKVHAAANKIVEKKDKVTISQDDEDAAREAFSQNRDLTVKEMSTAGVVLKMEALLTAYDRNILADAQKVRNYTVAQLMEMSRSSDEKIAIKALELLGKVSEVGLFAERHIVTVKDQRTEELEEMIRKKLEFLIDPEDVIDVEEE